MPPISRGFHRRRQPDADPSRVPPGQYVTRDFPVLSAGPTPHTPLEEWSFTIRGAVEEPVSWPWEEFVALPSETITTDIHCVTKWSKLDTSWKGVSVDILLEAVQSEAGYLTAWSDGGYTTNLALEDVTGGQAWVAYEFGGAPLEPEHGGPARMLIPHLYFWKSAKWVRGRRSQTFEPLGSPSSQVMSVNARKRSLHQKQIVDDAVNAYVAWREECMEVWNAYGSWASAPPERVRCAHAAYRAALDREEAAAKVYAGLMKRVDHVVETGDADFSVL